MINWVDFGLRENTVTAGSTRPLIQLNGSVCQELEVVTIERNGYPDFNSAIFKLSGRGAGRSILAGDMDIEELVPIGAEICVLQPFDVGISTPVTDYQPLFIGRINGISRLTDSHCSNVLVKAGDVDNKIAGASVFGQRVLVDGDDSIFIKGLDAIFNEDGKPNASKNLYRKNGRDYKLFDYSMPVFWTYADVICYLFAEYSADSVMPEREKLLSLTDTQKPQDLNLNGMTVLSAVHECCGEAGIEFDFELCKCRGRWQNVPVFYRAGQRRQIELNCQRDYAFDLDDTNVVYVNEDRQAWPVTNRYIGFGDYKVFEATFELIKAWDSSLESDDYDLYSAKTNENFNAVKDVYRKWCLNETGAYTDEPYNRGAAYDFGPIFGTDKYLNKNRRFRPALTTDAKNRSIGYHLQVSYDNGNNWFRYGRAFNNLLDECGVWLSSSQLDQDLWFAALKGYLRFRITASVVADERLTAEIFDGPVNSTSPVIEDVYISSSRFKFRQISWASIFKDTTGSSFGVADEVDDRAKLTGFLRNRAQADAPELATYKVRTPMIYSNCYPGDGVLSSPESKDWLGCKNDNRSIFSLKSAKLDFEKQYTQLQIIRKRKVHLDGR